MMNFTKFVACLCACFCLARTAMAWDAEGHMVVAQIAYNHLDDAVKAKCNALLAVPVYHSTVQNSNFVTAACWADDIKSFTSAFSDSHYIDIAISLDGTPTNGASVDPSNVVVAIRSCITKLQDPTQSLSNQAVALRFLLHFCGDITQPLHCSTGVTAALPGGDAGGNDFDLTSSSWSELHALWDAGGGFLSDSVTRPFTPASQAIITNKAAVVEAAYPYSASVGSIPDPMPWALEGRGIAAAVSYVGISNGGSATPAYLSTAQSTTIQRLAIGGQRLAKLLSTIYVTNAPPLTSTLITTNTFNLTWDAVTNRIYRVQQKQDLTNTNWTDVTDLTVSNTSLSFSDPVAQPQQFYRVIVVN